MRTLVFATKKHIEYIDEFRPFFKPFLDKQVVFCEWNQNAMTLDESVPGIYDAIAGEREWRAIILFDPKSDVRKQMNPFDMNRFCDDNNLLTEGTVNHRKKVYERSISNPLTRLTTYLSVHPLVSYIDGEEAGADSEDSIYVNQYERDEARRFALAKDLSRHKEMLRKQLLESGTLKSNMPKYIQCVALRTIKTEAEADKEKIDLAWKSSSDVMYSNFCDSNMYFDVMRFFVYDILPEGHVNYRYEYLKFIYSLMIFASNSIPAHSTVPGRLYALESHCTEEKLKVLITNYLLKLENTVVAIDKKIKAIQDDIPTEISDKEAEQLFRTSEHVQVSYSEGFHGEMKNHLFPKSKAFKLVDRMPDDEKKNWGEMHQDSVESMKTMLKQPARSVARAVDKLRERNHNEDIRMLGLNKFQVQDIEDFVQKEQSKMIDIEVDDFHDISKYLDQVDEDSKNINKVLKKRMTAKTAAILALSILVVFLIGFIPFIITNKGILSGVILTWLVILGCAALLASGIVSLILSRQEVIDKVDAYNEDMEKIKNDVDVSMRNFEKYLSSSCNVLRGNSIINALKLNDNIFKQRIRILHNHIKDIRDKQSEIYELFGEYTFVFKADESMEPFDYNFELPERYEYPIPFVNEEYRIPYLEDESRAVVPFDFVDEMTMRMEEIYE